MYSITPFINARTNRTSQYILFVSISLLMMVSISVNAALINRGGGMIYDDVLDVTWLQDANYMQTSGYDLDGFGNHNAVSTWAANLEFRGYSDWRLPSIKPRSGGAVYDWSFSFNGASDRGFNNSSQLSELGYMFYQNLGNVSYFSSAGVGPQPGSDSVNTSFVDGATGELFSFTNLNLTYWAQERDNPFLNAGWAFNFRTHSGIATGEQQIHGTAAGLAGWAVRDGDSFFASPPPPSSGSNDVPAPSTRLVLFTAIFLLLARSFRK